MQVETIAASAFQTRNVLRGIRSAPDTQVGVTNTASRPPPAVDPLADPDRVLALSLPASRAFRDGVARADSDQVADVSACPRSDRRDDDHEPQVQLTLARKDPCRGEDAGADDRNANPRGCDTEVQDHVAADAGARHCVDD